MRTNSPKRMRSYCRQTVRPHSFKPAMQRSKPGGCDEERIYFLTFLHALICVFRQTRDSIVEMVRKTISLVVILSLSQAFAFAAICDMRCQIMRADMSHAKTAASHEHHHPASHMHANHAMHEHANVHCANTASSCHLDVSTGCATTCISVSKAGKSYVSTPNLVLAASLEKTDETATNSAQFSESIPLPLPTRPASSFTVLRI